MEKEKKILTIEQIEKLVPQTERICIRKEDAVPPTAEFWLREEVITTIQWEGAEPHVTSKKHQDENFGLGFYCESRGGHLFVQTKADAPPADTPKKVSKAAPKGAAKSAKAKTKAKK